MKCRKCGHRQEDGKFCGLCGGELIIEDPSASGESEGYRDEGAGSKHKADHLSDHTEGVTSHQEPIANQGAQTTEAYDQVVATSREFGSFFQDFLKNPSRIFDEGSKQLTNAIITVSLLSIIFSLLLYQIVKVDIGIIRTPFIPTAGSALLFIVLSMGVVISILFFVNKLFGHEDLSFIHMFSIYGVLMIPSILLFVVSFLLAVIKSYMFAMILLIFGLGLTLMFIPLYITNYFIIQYRKNIDPLYAYLIYIILSSIGIFIVQSIFPDVMIGKLTEQFLFPF